MLASSQHGRLVLRLTEGFAQDGVLVLELDARIKTFTSPPLDMLDDLALKQRLNEIGKIAADPHEALRNCPHNCPCELPKQDLQSQQQPNRLIEEVKETEGFTRKIEDVRAADFRLANRRLQPLGHLTADL